MFVVMTLPSLAVFIQYALSSRKSFAQLAGRNAFYTEQMMKPALCSASSIILVLVLLLVWSPLLSKTIESIATPPQDKHPVSETAWLLEHYPCAVLFNWYDYGGYIIHASQGNMKVFIDGRSRTAYPDDIEQQYLKFAFLRDDTKALLDRYHINAVMIPAALQSHTNFFDKLPGWKTAYEGSLARIVMREPLLKKGCASHAGS
jgi:hypothetical protein